VKVSLKHLPFDASIYPTLIRQKQVCPYSGCSSFTPHEAITSHYPVYAFGPKVFCSGNV